MRKRLAALFCLFVFIISQNVQAAEEVELPVTPEEMPFLYLSTADGSNAFADQYDREGKLQGPIHYMDGTVAVSMEEDGEHLLQEKAQLKAR